MGANIPLPALDVRPPAPQPDATEQYLRLKGALGQQQLQQQQIQAGNLENQMRQQQVSDMQTIQKIAPQYVKKDENGRPIGYDYDGLTNGAIAAGVRPQSLAPLQTMQKTAADTYLAKMGGDKDAIANQEALNKQGYEKIESLKAITDPQQRQSAWLDNLHWASTNKIDVSKFPVQAPSNDALTGLEATFGMHAQALADAKTQAETTKDIGQGGEAQAATQAKQAEAAFYKANPAAGAPGVPAETASMADFLRRSPGAGPANYAGWKAAQEARATQPYKIQQAAAEGQARQMIQGMGETVYAVKADGSKVPMSKTDALQLQAKGQVKMMFPVNEKQVGEDIMLNNRLGDVRQKIAQYEQSMKADLLPYDQGRMASLLGTDKLKVGAFGTSIPTDRINAAVQAENLKGLSEPARAQLIAYRNVREALLGYQRVLTGSARSNEKQFEVNEQTIADPSIADKSFAAQSIAAFKQNLNVVGQGLPDLSSLGVKSPDQIEQQVTQPNTEPQSWFSQFKGKPR